MRQPFKQHPFPISVSESPSRAFLSFGVGIAFALLALAGCEPAPEAEAGSPSPMEGVTQEVMEVGSQYHNLRVERIVDGISNPWAIAFLPGERILITERDGALHLLEDGALTEISGLPEVHAQNQGGLMDVVPHPDYEANGWLYLTYSKGDSDGTVPALIRAQLEGSELTDVEELFESNTVTSPGRHYGSRVLFMGDGTLLMTIGDRGAEPARAQDTQDHSGTVVRLNEDGSVPDDNPFVGEEGYAPEIYTYGHRNIQGIILHPETGEVWATEHGPRGGDELNLLVPGTNYGWPEATLGRDYGTQEQFGGGDSDRHLPGMEEPVWEFLPTLAPSGLAVVSGTFDNWEGDLLAGGLRSERVLRVVLEEGAVVHIEELFTHDLGRIRDVRQGPDGAIYLAIDDSDGAIYRVEVDD